MVKILRPGKVVILTRGRFAGRKALVVKTFDEGTSERPYPHIIVIGVKTHPRNTKPSMSQKEIRLRSKINMFIKVINASHVMPTRYSVEKMDLDKVVTNDSVDITQRRAAIKRIVPLFQARYISGENPWFFSKLRF